MSLAVKNHPLAASVDSNAGHPYMFNPNPRTVTWERLENIRLRNLGLGPNRYSRHFTRFDKQSTFLSDGHYERSSKPASEGYIIVGGQLRKVNSVAPFYTVSKPTCGFFFSRCTDNKKSKIGIPPTNLVKWRSFVN